MIEDAIVAMPRSKSSAASGNNERLEPKLLLAVESDSLDSLEDVFEAATATGQLNPNFLKVGLLRSCERGKVVATEFLLKRGASTEALTGAKLTPLLRAVERNDIPIVSLLITYGASLEATDKKGRTALMTAAWKNHWHILSLLISKGADLNAKDSRKRSVLHNLAADKQCEWGMGVVDLLLEARMDIDTQDELGRTPFHWACATGKPDLARRLLSVSGGSAVNINAKETRSKTPLHMAIAHDREDIVQMLLENGAKIELTSDGGWTPLHNACDKGHEKIVMMLLKKGADVNSKLLNGMTTLHLACQGGHERIVKALLNCDGIKRRTRDTFGSTPLLRAAQGKHQNIVDLLSPFNHVKALSEDAIGACMGFEATIVDFGDFHNENKVSKHSVYDLLFGRDARNQKDPNKHLVKTLPGNIKGSKYRWIHLPANNMAWVEALLTKIFIEEGYNDIEGFKDLEKSFSYQHRGKQTHSQYMRPLCQSTPRSNPFAETEKIDPMDTPSTPKILVNGSTKDSQPETLVKKSKLGEAGNTKPVEASKDDRKGRGTATGEKPSKGPKPTAKNKQSGNETPKSQQGHHQGRKQHLQTSGGKSHGRPLSRSPSKPDLPQKGAGNICMFMPYLHFETYSQRQEMNEAIKRAEALQFRPALAKAKTFDEMLIRAHLNSSTSSLHVRRTLDQFFYHNIDCQGRDEGQVVYRYQTDLSEEDDATKDPKIFMVDQLWMWILGNDLLVTSFPQRWQQPKDDPLNVLEGVILDINSKTRDPVQSIYDVAMIITGRCSGIFDRHRVGDGEYQFLDMFDSSIGSAMDREATLFDEFNAASKQASEWLEHHRKPTRFSEPGSDLQGNKKEPKPFRYEESGRPLFVDKLLDIGHEISLLADARDIRDELNMIQMVLDHQKTVLPDLQKAISAIYVENQRSQREMKLRFEEQLKIIEMHIKDIERMDKQTKRIYDSVTDLLDLKQKHANALEARFARDQAAGTARQGQTIMVFTIVTIIFLPLSFIAAVFAINIEQFERNAENLLDWGYVAKYMFGIGFAISIPLVCVALSVDNIRDFWRDRINGFKKWRAGGKSVSAGVRTHEDRRSVDDLRLETVLSVAKSVRGVNERDWILPVHNVKRRTNSSEKGRLDRVAAAAADNGNGDVKGFRIRYSRDVERGA